jgi:hypothetical protein
LDLLRWGLVPYWAKDLNVGFANIDAGAPQSGDAARYGISVGLWVLHRFGQGRRD